MKTTAANSRFKKLAVQWLNEHLLFLTSVVLTDSLVLPNRQLLKPANRCDLLSLFHLLISNLRGCLKHAYIYESCASICGQTQTLKELNVTTNWIACNFLVTNLAL